MLNITESACCRRNVQWVLNISSPAECSLEILVFFKCFRTSAGCNGSFSCSTDWYMKKYSQSKKKQLALKTILVTLFYYQNYTTVQKKSVVFFSKFFKRRPIIHISPQTQLFVLILLFRRSSVNAFVLFSQELFLLWYSLCPLLCYVEKVDFDLHTHWTRIVLSWYQNYCKKIILENCTETILVLICKLQCDQHLWHSVFFS